MLHRLSPQTYYLHACLNCVMVCKVTYSCLKAIFSAETGPAGGPPPPVLKENCSGFVEQGFFYSPDVLPATQPLRWCTEGNTANTPNQWSGLILSSSTTGLLAEGALLPLHWLTETTTCNVLQSLCNNRKTQRQCKRNWRNNYYCHYTAIIQDNLC